MILPRSYWGAAEWFVVLLWKAVTLTMTSALVYLATTGSLSYHVGFGLFAVPFFLMFLLMQPDV